MAQNALYIPTDYYLLTCYIRVTSRVSKRRKTEDLRKLGSIRKVSKPHRMRAQSSCQSENFFNIIEKQKLNFSRIVLFHMKNRVCLKYFLNDCGSTKRRKM